MSGHTATAVPHPAVLEPKPCNLPTRDAFHIAIICALSTEANPVTVLLDHEGHDVVVVHMPGPGLTSAAGVATHLQSTFTNISVCFVVGVCGGVPAPSDGVNILLGDVIIATAVVQTDTGRQYPEGFSRKTGVEDSLGRAGGNIRGFLGKLQSDCVHERLRQKTEESMTKLTSNDPFSKARYPGLDKHVLYPAEYRHKHHDRPCEICDRCDTQHDPVCDVALRSSCDELGCKAASQDTQNRTDQISGTAGDEEGMAAKAVRQELRGLNIHFGRIASSNQASLGSRWKVLAHGRLYAKAVLEEWRDTDRATDERIDGRSMVVSLGSVDRVNPEVGRQTVNGNVFYGSVHYYGQVGLFDEVIHNGKEAIKRSKQSIQHSQEQREAQSNHIDSLMETVEAVGSSLMQLFLGDSFMISSLIALSANYFRELTSTQVALGTRIKETETISEDLHASNDKIQAAMIDVDRKLDELYALLPGQDYATENLSIDDAAPEDPQPPREQVTEEADAGETGVHHTDQVTIVDTNFCPERPTSEATEPLTDQGKEAESSSGHASSPDAVQNQQSKTIQLLKEQLATLEGQKCELSTQLDLSRREVEAQQEALEISEARIRDLEARERETERQRRGSWCSIL
ncbi:hypothetical protein BDW59DRAFT_159038 [Aspergillus cavernicola]|uniref:Nucleoside phosphorylase domain-containing protein n=1 Tax=Aspergillus cavernicola TaxID=176166 RepID=A0ABR4INU7_9EURO